MSMQGHPGADREWEHWPGRGLDDGSLRGRLRSLFAATDGEATIEALIDERSRGLEAQTQQLARTITDLEAREERARELRDSVEDMLRRGSIELDERHAELSALARQLGERESRLAHAEEQLAERKQELGAVELLRASVERREDAASERESELERAARELADRERNVGEIEARERELTERLAELTEAQAASAAASPPADAHVVVVPGERYALVERKGPPPAPGDELVLDGVALQVLRHGASPLPGDRRPCVVVERRTLDASR